MSMVALALAEVGKKAAAPKPTPYASYACERLSTLLAIADDTPVAVEHTATGTCQVLCADGWTGTLQYGVDGISLIRYRRTGHG